MFTSAVVVAAATIIAVFTATHGVLKPMMASRGIRRWSIGDTLASAPTVWVGSAAVGGASGLAGLTVGVGGTFSIWAIIVVLGLGGWLLLLLGIMELRKLH